VEPESASAGLASNREEKMCNSSCIEFGSAVLSPNDVADRSILEVGSYNVNGSLRAIVSKLGPREYIGVDLTPCNHTHEPCASRPCVDSVCNAENLIEEYGLDRFDVVISTELLEHAEDWKKAVHNFKGVLKSGGLLLLTTRSPGFARHEFPSDYWRFTGDDMQGIFSDMTIERLQDDPDMAGIFVSARKPRDFRENDLRDYDAFSMTSPSRVYYVTARNEAVPAMEKAISRRTFRSCQVARDFRSELNRVVGWGFFAVVSADFVNDAQYLWNFVED
jgi:SAM-dependent methyltransferase